MTDTHAVTEAEKTLMAEALGRMAAGMKIWNAMSHAGLSTGSLTGITGPSQMQASQWGMTCLTVPGKGKSPLMDTEENEADSELPAGSDGPQRQMQQTCCHTVAGLNQRGMQ